MTGSYRFGMAAVVESGSAELHSADADRSALPVKVIRSERRRKTSAARVVDGTIEVRIPSWMSPEAESHAVAELVARIEKKRAIRETPVDLVVRAAELAERYDLPEPAEIGWVTNQESRWGSCSIGSGRIRISARLVTAPTWVLDYVVLHELTHLVEADHGPAFHALMDRYPEGPRAEGFLLAMDLGFGDERWTVG